MHAARFVAVLVVLLLVTIFVVTWASEAQQAASLPRVGFLTPASAWDLGGERLLQAFRQGLRELGYVEGQNIAIESRWADGKYNRLPGLAVELVRLKVNVIVAFTPPAVQAAKQATDTIPIVMVAVFDPLAMGFVNSLARPGGNIKPWRSAPGPRRDSAACHIDPNRGKAWLRSRRQLRVLQPRVRRIVSATSLRTGHVEKPARSDPQHGLNAPMVG